MKGIGRVPMTFIRAPYVESLIETPDAEICGGAESLTPKENFPEQSGVEVLATVEGRIVAVRYGNQIGTAFHPELDEDDRIHEMFLQMCREQE